VTNLYVIDVNLTVKTIITFDERKAKPSGLLTISTGDCGSIGTKL